MNFGEYCKDKWPILLVNAAAMLAAGLFLISLDTTPSAVWLILILWVLVLGICLAVGYVSRRRYFREIFQVLEELEERYLIGEVMKPGHRLEDKLYWNILQRSNKSVIEKIHELEKSQGEYKEYIESWIHEIKTPMTAAKLICENRRDEAGKQLLLELDEIQDQVEKILYYVRMEQVYRDYLIHPVPLRETVLQAARGQKRHFIQCGMSIEVDMDEVTVSTDEKWVIFILGQIFSNSRKYRRPAGAKIRISMKAGERQKSLVIEDNGRGIPAKDLGRIFQKGFTGKNGREKNSHATGMGLYICKRLCEKLDIGIVCQSKEGEYTRMILTFPDSDHEKIL